MRALSVFSLALVLALVLAACGGPDRRGGFIVVNARDSGVNSEGDSGRSTEEGDGSRSMENDGSERFEDAANWDDAWGADVWVPEDGSEPEGGVFEDAETFPDASGFSDASRPDATPPRDAGIADSGFPDLGIPFPTDAGIRDSGQPDSGTPPMYQTTVSMTPMTSQVVLDLNPPVAADPLTFTVDLTYDNVGPGAQVISITNVHVDALIFPIQDFDAGPDHNAPVGNSMQTVNKIAGSGMPISSPSTYCSLPAIVTIDFSNGQQLSDFSVTTCIP